MQIADAGSFKGAGERAPDAVMRGDLGAVNREVEIRIRTQERSDLLRLGFVDVELVGQQRGIIQLEAVFHLLPGPGLRRRLLLHSLRGRLGRAQARA